ncbi:MAG: type II secretion system protein [Pirellulales bacterium]|nr:type II secretion system protein [Pirellulales bacterium]
MNRERQLSGFTLIEVMIVVIIVAVLAGTIIPRFLGSTDDAKQSLLQHNLHLLEAQIEMYRAQHKNVYPTIQENALPQLTKPTNALGEIGAASGPDYPYGPYILEPPMNPYDGSKNVVAVSTPGEEPTGVVGGAGGWQYDVTTGAIWPNNLEYFE